MDFLSIAVHITFIALCISLVLAFYRVIAGPSLPDRVVAIDLIAYLVIGFIATYCISVGQPVYLDAAIILALIAFLGTMAFARYIAHPKVENRL
ncbi:MAG: cation:proton antiporter [Balneolales bacterium]